MVRISASAVIVLALLVMHSLIKNARNLTSVLEDPGGVTFVNPASAGTPAPVDNSSSHTAAAASASARISDDFLTDKTSPQPAAGGPQPNLLEPISQMLGTAPPMSSQSSEIDGLQNKPPDTSVAPKKSEGSKPQVFPKRSLLRPPSKQRKSQPSLDVGLQINVTSSTSTKKVKDNERQELDKSHYFSELSKSLSKEELKLYGTIDELTNKNASAICGMNKCFFRRPTAETAEIDKGGISSSNSNVGYLMATNRNCNFDMKKAYNLVSRLTKDHPEIPSFDIENEPPEFIRSLDPHYADLLNNANLMNTDGTKKVEFARPNATICIQRMRIAPEPNLVFGCIGPKYNHFEKAIQSFIAEHVLMGTVNVSTSIQGVHETMNTTATGATSNATTELPAALDSFIDTFRRNMLVNANSTMRGDYDCLTSDFQLLVDKHGNVYHIDVDRCFTHKAQNRPNNENIRRSCLRNLQTRVMPLVYQMRTALLSKLEVAGK